jgi:hypothetical protein
MGFSHKTIAGGATGSNEEEPLLSAAGASRDDKSPAGTIGRDDKSLVSNIGRDDKGLAGNIGREDKGLAGTIGAGSHSSTKNTGERAAF